MNFPIHFSLFFSLGLLGACAQAPERDVRPFGDGAMVLDRGVVVDVAMEPSMSDNTSTIADASGETSVDVATACDGALRQCGATCVDTETNRNHCGRCNNECDPLYRCVDGRCMCVNGRC